VQRRRALQGVTDHVGIRLARRETHAADGTVWTLALLQGQLTNQGDAWVYTVDQLARLLEAPAAVTVNEVSVDPPVERFQVLARRVAELHVALARRTGAPAFDPEPVEARDLQRWTTAVREECTRTLALLEDRRAAWASPQSELAAQVVQARASLLAIVDRVAQSQPLGVKTRIHGDLHLEQVLVCRDDFFIIDFEGEPQRTFEERRAKHSALRDVASMLRSFDYARHTALHQVAQGAGELERLAPVARRWERWVRTAFLETYREITQAAGLYPGGAGFEAAHTLLDLFELEKALYELRYEIDNRPEWVGVPLAGIAVLAGIST
ncbi:MAG: alpha-amylase, partial [Rubrivivax sp.]|nr:alpha-amylase [Rubrivivax sp.]